VRRGDRAALQNDQKEKPNDARLCEHIEIAIMRFVHYRIQLRSLELVFYLNAHPPTNRREGSSGDDQAGDSCDMVFRCSGSKHRMGVLGAMVDQPLGYLSILGNGFKLSHDGRARRVRKLRA
jgi:hypothetical protein